MTKIKRDYKKVCSDPLIKALQDMLSYIIDPTDRILIKNAIHKRRRELV